MRNFAASVAVTAILAGCAIAQDTAPPRVPQPEDQVTYYDRNLDHVVDFELHQPRCSDCDWALVDMDFNGRYDKQVDWGIVVQRHAVNLPVPRDAPTSPMKPPDWAIRP